MSTEHDATDEDTDGETDESGDNTDTGEPAEPAVETINSMKALWARPKNEISAEEYAELYRHVAVVYDDPLEVIHLQAEGTFEYQAVLFIPSRAPLDLYQQGHRRGLQLYVKRVFIMDDCEALLPEYLRFIRGVVDAADLSLNVSREILQQDRHIQLIRRRLVKKVLATIKEMAQREDGQYAVFWQQFGRALKEGLISDPDNRESILDVTSLSSTHDPAQLTTLRQYVERMPEDQDRIYYVTGESRSAAERSPHLEAFQANGLEVLLLTDPVDEVWVQTVGQYDGIPIQSIAEEPVDPDTDEDEAAAEDNQPPQYADLLAWLGTELEDDIKNARVSSRLTTSAACLVGDANDLTPARERMFRAMGHDVPHTRRVLEINPDHPLVSRLQQAHSQRPDDPELAETAELLYGIAVLAEGRDLTDPAEFSRLLADRLARTMQDTNGKDKGQLPARFAQSRTRV